MIVRREHIQTSEGKWGGVTKIRADSKFTIEDKEETLGSRAGLTPSVSGQFSPVLQNPLCGAQ